MAVFNAIVHPKPNNRQIQRTNLSNGEGVPGGKEGLYGEI